MTKEAEDLATHVSLCELRYQGIQEKFAKVDVRLNSIEQTLSEIKRMILEQRDAKFRVMVGSASTVIVALIGMLGYLITHLK